MAPVQAARLDLAVAPRCQGDTRNSICLPLTRDGVCTGSHRSNSLPAYDIDCARAAVTACPRPPTHARTLIHRHTGPHAVRAGTQGGQRGMYLRARGQHKQRLGLSARRGRRGLCVRLQGCGKPTSNKTTRAVKTQQNRAAVLSRLPTMSSWRFGLYATG